MAAKKDEFGTNAAKPKGKPRGKGKPFEGADDPRRNKHGQRSAATVAFSRTLRELIVEKGEAKRAIVTEAGTVEKKNVEWMVERIWQEAHKGEQWAVNFIAERTEGKVNQGIDVFLKMIDLNKLNDEQLDRVAAGENPVTVIMDAIASLSGTNSSASD